MKTHYFFRYLLHSPIRLAAVLLAVLVFAVPALCGPIHDAVRDGDLAKVQALLKDNPKLVFSKEEFTGATPLHCAAGTGHKDVAELLLAKGAEVNVADIDGRTPLHYAATMGHKNVVELLLAKGAYVNAKDKNGATPLSLATFLGYKDIAELLRQHGGHM